MSLDFCVLSSSCSFLQEKNVSDLVFFLRLSQTVIDFITLKRTKQLIYPQLIFLHLLQAMFNIYHWTSCRSDKIIISLM